MNTSPKDYLRYFNHECIEINVYNTLYINNRYIQLHIYITCKLKNTPLPHFPLFYFIGTFMYIFSHAFVPKCSLTICVTATLPYKLVNLLLTTILLCESG